MKVIHLYSLIKIGGNYTSFRQSFCSAAELEKIKIIALGKCVLYLIHFFMIR